MCCVAERTESVWTFVLERQEQFENQQYMETKQPLWPSSSLKKLALWTRYYSRWDPEVRPRQGVGDEDDDWADNWGSPAPSANDK